MPDGRVTYSDTDGLHVLHYFGRVDYTMAPAVDRFVDSLLSGPTPDGTRPGGVRPFVFDMTDARLIDSTNLGLVARIAHRVQGAGRCTIVSDSEDIDDVLDSMGFQAIFDLVTDHPAVHGGASEAAITGEECTQGELLRTMLEAHRTLASLNEKDRAEFKDVVSLLEAESRR
jgi:anti-anti-sigma factor